jgi:hypothetical protein
MIGRPRPANHAYQCPLLFARGTGHLLIFLAGNGLVQLILIDRQILVCQLSMQERNGAVIAFSRAAAFNYVALETVLPGISTFITELSSHTFTSSLQKVVLV